MVSAKKGSSATKLAVNETKKAIADNFTNIVN